MKDLFPNMNDDELDRLFREAAREYAEKDGMEGLPVQRERSWEKLQEQLDASSPDSLMDDISRNGNKRKFLLLVFLMILTGVVIWQINDRNPEPVATQLNRVYPKSSSSRGARNERRSPPEWRSRAGNLITHHEIASSRPTHKSLKTGFAMTKRQVGKHQLNIHQQLSQKKISKIPQAPSDTKKAVKTITGVKKDIYLVSGTNVAPSKGEHNRDKKLISVEAKPLQAIPQLEPVQFISQPIKSEPVNNDIALSVIQDIKNLSKPFYKSDNKFNNTRVISDKGSLQDKNKNKNKNKKQNIKIPHWYLGITAGPAWSSVSGEGWGTGFDGGMVLDYKLNRKWMFETGIIAEKTLYTAFPYNYNPPGNGWTYNVKSIDANCIIIDVPLNVNYTIWNNKENAVLIGAGLSSTWMRHETYTYNVKTNSGAWEKYEKEMSNKEYHIFSMLNFSAGYQRAWNNFSLGITPYVKIPLRGIGYGRVKLLSTGIHFSLRYGLK